MKIQLIVIGGGPAGLAAAIEAKKNGVLDVLVLERDKNPGGILQQCIHSGFGLHIFKEQLTGPEYAQKFIDEAIELGIEIKGETMVLSITDKKQVTAINPQEGVFTLYADAVILAMGCRERPRGTLNIPGTRPSGIFTAGTAQRLINMEGYKVGRKAVILGSGDIGLIMARRMTLEGAEVGMVVEIMPYSSGLRRNIVQCLEDFDIPLLYRHTVVKIHGTGRLEGVTVAEVDNKRIPVKGTERFVECDTLLISAGLIPENELSREAGIELDEVTRGPLVDETMMTSIEGIFACGNVVHVHDLVDNVTIESRLAGRGAAGFLKGRGSRSGRLITITPGKGIRYVLPQTIHPEGLVETLNLYMRADNVYENALITICDGERVIGRYRRKIVTPGEMMDIKLEPDVLQKVSSDKLLVKMEV